MPGLPPPEPRTLHRHQAVLPVIFGDCQVCHANMSFAHQYHSRIGTRASAAYARLSLEALWAGQRVMINLQTLGDDALHMCGFYVVQVKVLIILPKPAFW